METPINILVYKGRLKIMSNNEQQRPHHTFLQSITLGDLLKIGAAIVSISIAWGVFSTRLAVAELQLVVMQEKVEVLAHDVKSLQMRLDELGRSSIENQYMVDDLWMSQKGALPTRRN